MGILWCKGNAEHKAECLLKLIGGTDEHSQALDLVVIPSAQQPKLLQVIELLFFYACEFTVINSK